jgi:hypothetical protein
VKVIKTSRRIIGVLTSSGVIATLGFLSFVGMLAISPYIAFAIGAFLVTALIEGEVYKQNIVNGLKKLFSLDYVKQSVIERELETLLDEAQKEQRSEALPLFLSDYGKQLEKVNELRSCKSKGRRNLYYAANLNDIDLATIEGSAVLLIGTENPNIKTAYFVKNNEFIDIEQGTHLTVNIELSDGQKNLIPSQAGVVKPKNPEEKKLLSQILIKAKYTQENYQLETKTLKAMQKYSIQCLDSPENTEIFTKTQKQQLKNEIQRKVRINGFSSIFCLGGGVSFFFTSINSVNAGVITLMTLSAFAIPSVVLSVGLPVAILAAIGYSITLFNNILDIVTHDKFQHLIEKIVRQFQYDGQQNKVIYAIKIAGISLLLLVGVSSAIFATVATAGTWWFAVKDGSRLLPFFTKAGSLIRDITVPLMSVPSLLFNGANTLESISEISKFSLRKKVKSFLNKVKKGEDESWGHYLNPFHLLVVIIKALFVPTAFSGHSISSGVMSDNLGNLSPFITASLSSTNETIGDAHYIFGKEHEEKTQNNTNSGKNKHSGKMKSHGHSHSHENLMDKLLHIPLLPLYILSALWDKTCDLITGAQNKKSFYRIFKSNFVKENKNYAEISETSEVSSLWKRQELILRIEKKINRYERNIFEKIIYSEQKSKDKKQILEELLARIKGANIVDNNSNPNDQKGVTLAKVIDDYLKEEFSGNKLSARENNSANTPPAAADNNGHRNEQQTNGKILKENCGFFKVQETNSDRFIKKLLEHPSSQVPIAPSA